MSSNCYKEAYNGRCGCNCQYQVEIRKHPWNTGEAKGSIMEVLGYGCRAPDLQDERKMIIFFDKPHCMCELYTKRIPIET